MTGYDSLTIQTLRYILSNHRKQKIHSLHLKLSQGQSVSLDDDVWLGLIRETIQKVCHHNKIVLEYEYVTPSNPPPFAKQITKPHLVRAEEATMWWKKNRFSCFQTLGQLRASTTHAI